jgi:hypothetical protein
MNKLNLQTIFEKQKDFSSKFFKEKFNLDIDNLSSQDKLKWSKEFILSGAKELFEMLDELPSWKTHRIANQKENLSNFLEEGIDSFKFLLNILIINGFSAEDFSDCFFNKSKVVEIRYQQENQLVKLKNSKEEVIVIDIDGVLNNYPLNFISYFQSKCIKYDSIKEFKTLNLSSYNEQKNQFRINGFEAKCNVNDGVIEKLKSFNKENKIILLTARPYEKISRLFSDTLEWIKDNNICCDFVFFNKNKEEWLINNFDKAQIKFIVDDQIDNVNKLIKYFDNVYLVKNLSLYLEEDYENVNKSIKIISSITEING